MRNNPTELAKLLQYPFVQLDHLQLALTHRSYDGQKNNERLEFLGDSILNFVIGEALFNLFPEAKEGQLSRLRASMVKGATLTKVAQQLGLGPYLLLGAGELKSGGSRRNSILADAVEAIIGAIYLDSDLEVVRGVVLSWYQSRLEAIKPGVSQKDPKTRLQEFLQGRRKPLPVYTVTNIKGEAHNQEFTVECEVAGVDKPVIGKGTSRRKAEQAAAETALEQLTNG